MKKSLHFLLAFCLLISSFPIQSSTREVTSKNLEMLSRSGFKFKVVSDAEFFGMQIPTTKTTVSDLILNPDSTPRVGTVTFILTQAATSAEGLIAASATVGAVLDAQGRFTVKLFPSVGLNPQSYYQVWFAQKGNLSRELIGLYQIPVSASIVTLAPYKVTDTALVARYVFADQTSVNNLSTNAASAATAVFSASTDTRIPFWDAAQKKFLDSAIRKVAGGAETVGTHNVTGILSAPVIQSGSVTATGTVTAAYLVGNGAGITGLAGATGGVSNSGSTSIIADNDQNGVGVIDQIIGTDTITRAQSNRFEVLKELDAQFGFKAFVRAGLPAATSSRRITQLTDSTKGLMIDIGGQHVELDGGRINIKLLGAKCDGTTNDTAAFVDADLVAQATGFRVYVPASVSGCVCDSFATTGPLVIEGDGDKSLIIRKPTTGTDEEMINSTYDLILKNLKINGNKANVPYTRAGAVDLVGVTANLTIENVTFINTIAAAFRVVASNQKTSVKRSRFFDMAEGDGGTGYPNMTMAGYVQGGSGEVELIENEVRSPTPSNPARAPAGFQVTGTDRNAQLKYTALNNTFTNIGSSSAGVGAIDVYEFVRAPLVHGNKCFNGYYSCLKIENSDEAVISKNIIQGSSGSVGAAAIFISGSSRTRIGRPWHNITIEGNVVKGYANLALQAQGDNDIAVVSRRWLLKNNQFDGNARGIVISNIGDSEIDGGSISNTSNSAVEGAAITIRDMPNRTFTIKNVRLHDNASYGIAADVNNAGMKLILQGNYFKNNTYDNVYVSDASAPAVSEILADNNQFDSVMRPFFFNNIAVAKLMNNRTLATTAAPALGVGTLIRHGNDFDFLVGSGAPSAGCSAAADRGKLYTDTTTGQQHRCEGAGPAWVQK